MRQQQQILENGRTGSGGDDPLAREEEGGQEEAEREEEGGQEEEVQHEGRRSRDEVHPISQSENQPRPASQSASQAGTAQTASANLAISRPACSFVNVQTKHLRAGLGLHFPQAEFRDVYKEVLALQNANRAEAMACLRVLHHVPRLRDSNAHTDSKGPMI